MKAKSIKGNTTEEIQSALLQSMSDGFKPTLAIVFISIKQNRDAVCTLLREKDIDIVGATSSGEFINGYHSQGEAAILLLAVNKDYYSILFRETAGKQLEEVAQEAATAAIAKFSHPAFILISSCLSAKGEQFDGVTLIHSLENSLGAKTDIFGGMSGDDANLAATWVFTDSQTTDEGFILLALDKNYIDLFGVALSGWKPLGKTRTITKCEEGWLYSIDDQPALDMYLRYLGESLEEKDGTKKSFIDNIAMFHPFLCLDDGDPVLRTPMYIDKETNAIKLDFPIPEGKHLQFTLPPDFDIVESVLEKASAIQKRSGVEADALLIFSCLGRVNALGPMVHQENEGLYEIWNAPMAGFFTYGEYGKDTEGSNRMHSTTCSWVALKEK